LKNCFLGVSLPAHKDEAVSHVSSSSSKLMLHKEQPAQKERGWSDTEGHQVQKTISGNLLDTAHQHCVSAADS